MSVNVGTRHTQHRVIDVRISVRDRKKLLVGQENLEATDLQSVDINTPEGVLVPGLFHATLFFFFF